MNAVLGGTLLIGTSFIALNLMSDLLYPLVDPRARAVDERRRRAQRPAAGASGCSPRRRGRARQARLGRWYRGWLAFRRNGLAVAGLAIVLSLILIAARRR